VHAEAKRAEDTDSPQVAALYRVLDVVAPSPIVTLNRAVAVAMVHGPQAGLGLVATLDSDDRVARHHRVPAVRADGRGTSWRHGLPTGGRSPDHERCGAALSRGPRGRPDRVTDMAVICDSP
jgi:hypothetical protein